MGTNGITFAITRRAGVRSPYSLTFGGAVQGKQASSLKAASAKGPISKSSVWSRILESVTLLDFGDGICAGKKFRLVHMCSSAPKPTP